MIINHSHASAQSGPWQSFTNGFVSFIELLSNIGDVAEREYLEDQLSGLHEDLFEIEKDKEHLLTVLRRPVMSDSNGRCVRLLKDLEMDVKKTQSRLRNIGARVARVSAKASQLEMQMDTALFSRKSWLTTLNGSCSINSDNNLMSEGQHALESVRAARKNLEMFLQCSLSNECNAMGAE
mgnify:CR=1 FL=1